MNDSVRAAALNEPLFATSRNTRRRSTSSTSATIPPDQDLRYLYWHVPKILLMGVQEISICARRTDAAQLRA